ncbi:MAG TPA: transglutaminase domain-containing protein [Thermoleophilia bacterium]|nr:transglutaminase domain-containing protein [Thermoleophilia bacterium]
MLSRRALVFLAAAWILVSLYPDPGLLVRSVRNAVRPRILPEAVTSMAAALPDDPRVVEAHVVGRLVPYAYDWQSAGVPWYFPTTEEAVAAGRGDCESRALVLASILTAKGIPNELRLSLNHIWVDYPGKRATAQENAAVQVAGVEDGRFFLRWPRDFHLGRELSDQLAIYWTPAPVWRVVSLVVGLLLVALWNASVRLMSAGRGALDDTRAAAPLHRRAGRSPRCRQAAAGGRRCALGATVRRAGRPAIGSAGSVTPAEETRP